MTPGAATRVHTEDTSVAERDPAPEDISARSAGGILRAALREHLPLLAFVAIYVIGCSLVLGIYGIDGGRPFALGRLGNSFKGWFSLTLAPIIGFHLLHYTALHLRHRISTGRRHNSRSWLGGWTAYRKRHITLPRVLRLSLAVSAVAVIMTTFVSFKGSIPQIHPYSWDYSLMRFDRWLHGGRHPWELLHAVLGRPLITNFIDFTYYLWFPLGLGMVIWQAWSSDRRTRMQYFLTFGLTWALLGTVAATLFSSGGPVYYGRITGLADPFSTLMNYLYAVDSGNSLAALRVQNYLWEGYSGAADHSFEGIAAMPSLHVAMAVLFALVGFRWRRWAGVVLTVFAGLVLIGSVHLGWHYAIDGYASIVFVVICWVLVGWGLNRYWRPTEAVHRKV